MPIRYLKPGVRDSEAVNSLSPLAETLFYRLIVTVDDFGRFDGRPAMVKAHCFPIKDSVGVADCAALMAELREAGLLSLYEVEGKPYLQLSKWDNAPRAKESKYPVPPDACMQVHADAYVPSALPPETETETVTGNRKPETETGNRNRSGAQKRASLSPDRPDDVDPRTWEDFLAIRKAKRAPLTETALTLIEREAKAAGLTLQDALAMCCARGWQGFKAEWASSERSTSFATRRVVRPALPKSARDAEAMRLLGMGSGDVIDVGDAP